MKKLSLLICMSFLVCSLSGCDVIGFLTQTVGKNSEEKTEETSKKEDTEDKTEEKTENKTEEDTNVYELSVMDLLNDPETYNGKKVHVLGVIPEGNITNSDGAEVFGILSDDGNYYIEITGVMPDNRYCKSYVNGTANMVDGEIVIDATDYELVEQYEYVEEQTTDQSQVVEQPAVDQSQIVQQPQTYYYQIINGQYVFDSAEGQTYWNNSHPSTYDSSNDDSTGNEGIE